MKDFIGFRKMIMERQMNSYGTYEKKKRSPSATKADKLIDGIISGRYLNDEEAAWDLYSAKPMDKRYQMLKSRIKEQLLNYVFHVDIRIIQPAKNFGYNALIAHKYYAIGQFMFFYGLGSDGEELLKESLRIAKDYQIPGLIVNSSRYLKSWAGFKGTRREYMEFKKNIKENIDIYKSEIESDDMRDELNLMYRETFSPQDKEKLKRYWTRINLLNKKYQSQILRINRFKIGVKYFETMGDFKGVIRICDEMIEFVLKNPQYYQISNHRDFAMARLEACLIIKDYKRADESAETVQKLHNDYSPHAIIALEYIILLNLHTKKYEKAYLVLKKTVQKELLNEYSSHNKEKWKLFEAYISFVYPECKIKVAPSKLMKGLPVYSRDKKGINIAIIIAQIILLLDEGDFDTLLDRADSFKVYFKRYVNKQINYRTYHFVKMIETIFRYNFNYEMIKQKATEYHDHLTDKKGFYKGDIEALEIVPYEDLWSHIMLRLKKHEYTFMHPVNK